MRYLLDILQIQARHHVECLQKWVLNFHFLNNIEMKFDVESSISSE